MVRTGAVIWNMTQISSMAVGHEGFLLRTLFNLRQHSEQIGMVWAETLHSNRSAKYQIAYWVPRHASLIFVTSHLKKTAKGITRRDHPPNTNVSMPCRTRLQTSKRSTPSDGPYIIVLRNSHISERRHNTERPPKCHVSPWAEIRMSYVRYSIIWQILIRTQSQQNNSFWLCGCWWRQPAPTYDESKHIPRKIRSTWRSTEETAG